MSKVGPPPLDVYRIISDAIERAILPGLRKAEKRDLLRSNSDADLDAAAEIIHGYIMCDLDEVVRWPDTCAIELPSPTWPAPVSGVAVAPARGTIIYGCGCRFPLQMGQTVGSRCPNCPCDSED